MCSAPVNLKQNVMYLHHSRPMTMTSTTSPLCSSTYCSVLGGNIRRPLALRIDISLLDTWLPWERGTESVNTSACVWVISALLTLWGQAGMVNQGLFWTGLDLCICISVHNCINCCSFLVKCYSQFSCLCKCFVSSLTRTTNSHYIVQPSAVQGQSINLNPLLNLGHKCNFHCYWLLHCLVGPLVIKVPIEQTLL